MPPCAHPRLARDWPSRFIVVPHIVALGTCAYRIASRSSAAIATDTSRAGTRGEPAVILFPSSLIQLTRATPARPTHSPG